MNIVLTDWRGIFTAQAAELELLPHPENTHYGKLSLIALHHAPHTTIAAIPNIADNWKIIDSISPSEVFPYHAILIEHPTQPRNIILMSGDASTVLHHASISSHNRHAIQKEVFEQQSAGKFPIGIGYKHTHQSKITREDLHVLSFIGSAITFFPPVKYSRAVLQKLHDKNISVKIFTHMPLHLSRVIARSAGIYSSEDSSLTGSQIAEMNDEELIRHMPHATILAEMSLADEQRITRLLDKADHRVLHHDFSHT